MWTLTRFPVALAVMGTRPRGAGAADAAAAPADDAHAPGVHGGAPLLGRGPSLDPSLQRELADPDRRIEARGSRGGRARRLGRACRRRHLGVKRDGSARARPGISPADRGVLPCGLPVFRQFDFHSLPAATPWCGTGA